MNEILAILDKYGIEIEEARLGTGGRYGGFHDLYAGTGDEWYALQKAAGEIRAAGLLAKVEVGDVEGHTAYRKPYLVIGSIWLTPGQLEELMSEEWARGLLRDLGRTI